jgi:hypothetical protein
VEFSFQRQADRAPAATTVKFNPLKNPEIMERSVVVGLNGRSVPDVIVRTETVVKMMDSNAAFPSPIPDLQTYRSAVANLKNAQLQVTLVGGKNNTTLRNAALKVVKEMSGQLVAYVNLTAAGDEAKLVSSGFPLRKLPSPVGKQPALTNCKVSTQNLNVGEVKFYHDGNPKCKMYRYQYREVLDNGEAGPWSEDVTSTKRSHLFTGLQSGRLYQFRVAVLTTAGLGVWSDPVSARPQ